MADLSFCSPRDQLAARVHGISTFAWTRRMASVWVQRPEHGGHRITFTADEGRPIGEGGLGFRPEAGRWELVGPDLDDPATQGCLFAWLVRLRGGLIERALESLESERWRDVGAHYGETLARALCAVHGVEAPTSLGQRLLAWTRASGAPPGVVAVVAAKLSWGGWELHAIGSDGVTCVGRLQVSTHPKVDGCVRLEQDPETVEDLVDALDTELALRSLGRS